MRKLLLAMSMVALAACTDSTAPPTLQAGKILKDTDVNQTEPAAFAAFNPCNGDVVAMTGTIHTLVHTTTSGSGNTNVDIDITGNYAGVGVPTGVNYQGSTRDLNHFTTGDPFPVTFDIYTDLQLRSQTGEDNWTASLHYKVTINANGIPTATVDNINNNCNG